MAKKSLSEQISSLYTPKTDYDIEDHDLDVSKDNGIFQHHDGGSENESEDEDTGLRNEHYVESSKSKLRQQNEGVNLGKNTWAMSQAEANCMTMRMTNNQQKLAPERS